MREFDSAGLRQMARILQISTGQPQLVELQDQVLEQAIDLNPFLRRALVPEGSDGIFHATMLNTHSGSDIIETQVNPYAPGTTFAHPDWNPVDPRFDVWLLGAAGKNITGGGDFGGGQFNLISNALGMAWRNEANAAAMTQTVMTWDVERTEMNTTFLYSNQNDVLLLWEKGGSAMRINRDASTLFSFITEKAGPGSASFKLFLTLGLFPAGMGQDVIV